MASLAPAAPTRPSAVVGANGLQSAAAHAAASGGGKKTAEFTDALGTATPTAHFLPEDARREALRAARAEFARTLAERDNALQAAKAESADSASQASLQASQPKLDALSRMVQEQQAELKDHLERYRDFYPEIPTEQIETL